VPLSDKAPLALRIPPSTSIEPPPFTVHHDRSFWSYQVVSTPSGRF